MKSPAFQFYPDDFLGSGKVGTMTTEEVGAYMLLLCLDWNENGFVFEPEELARWCRMTRGNFRKVWKRVSRCFEEKDGRMYNPRLQMEREKQAEWREKSAKGGKASAQARAKGGSTTLQPPTQPNGNTPSPSPTPVTAKEPPTPAATPRVPDVSPDVAKVLLRYKNIHPTRRPGEKDRKAVVRALGFGYSADELCEALLGNARDDWHVERSKHELPYVLRDNGTIDTFRQRVSKPAVAVSSNGHSAAPDDADTAWDSVLSMLPAWQRREITADIHAALPLPLRRGLSKIGGFRNLSETPDAKRVWMKREFVAAYHATATEPAHV